MSPREDNGRIHKSNIIHYMIEHKQTSKSDLARALNLSMPTIMRYVNELTCQGIVKDLGISESTGGRKAGLFAISENHRISIGIDITANHVSIVLVNLRVKLIASDRYRIKYEHSIEFYKGIAARLEHMLNDNRIAEDQVLGIGISLPGIVDKKNNVLLYSHVLGLQNFSLNPLQSCFPYPLHFENDAVSAATAEAFAFKGDMVYLSLSNSVGGAIYIGGNMLEGDHYKSAEFGHLLLHPGGRKCYCGKKGCVDAYCNASILSSQADDRLESFFTRLQSQDQACLQVWQAYLEDLALTISNLRMVFDCSIVLGGYVGAFLEPYILDVEKEVVKNNLFEGDAGYIFPCQYRYEAAALGGAIGDIRRYIESCL